MFFSVRENEVRFNAFLENESEKGPRVSFDEIPRLSKG